MVWVVVYLLLGLSTRLAAATAAPEDVHSRLVNGWNDLDSGLNRLIMHTLVPRTANWNSTWIDSERNLCSDPIASEQCCPGYCSVDYQNSTGSLFYTCCPLGYYAAAFGKSNESTKVEILCCDETVSPCKKGKSTKDAVVPFTNATSDVQVLEKECSSSDSSSSDSSSTSSTSSPAPKLYISSTAILPTIAALLSIFFA